MRIQVAKTAGFCFGVDRAVKKAFEAADRYDKVVTLGPIIHNPQIVSQLAEKGVEKLNNKIITAIKRIKILF